MHRYTLRTARCTSPLERAREQRSLDDWRGGLPEFKVWRSERAQRKQADIERDPTEKRRRQHARSCLPASWLSRNPITSPEFPSPLNLVMWQLLGAHDALMLMLPRVSTNDPRPCAAFYAVAWTATNGAYMQDEPQQDEQPTPEASHPALSESLHPDIIYSLVIEGDMGKLNDGQRVAYYAYRCRELGIDAAEQPFNVLSLKGKTSLYLTKAGAAALTRVNRLSVEIKSFKRDGTLVIVEARASDPSGRFADDLGIVDTSEETLTVSNATMKAVTKAKRRAVIALVGLGVLDVTEVESIKGAKQGPPPRAAVAVVREALCSGKAQPIADSIRKLRAAYVMRSGVTAEKVWGSVLRKLVIPGNPEPEQLTIKQGADAKAAIKQALAKLPPVEDVDVIVGEIIDHDQLGRQPGEDDPADVEPPADWTGHNPAADDFAEGAGDR